MLAKLIYSQIGMNYTNVPAPCRMNSNYIPQEHCYLGHGDHLNDQLCLLDSGRNAIPHHHQLEIQYVIRDVKSMQAYKETIERGNQEGIRVVYSIPPASSSN